MDTHMSARHGVLAILLTAAMAAGCSRSAAKTAADPARSDAEPRTASEAASPTRGYVVSDSQWNDRNVARVEDLMRGRFPGVRVIEREGGIAVEIRGATTTSGRRSPLYVIDGFAIEAGPDGLLMLSPADIKKIEVLKDAASLTQYGVRAGNGVVVITTKRP